MRSQRLSVSLFGLIAVVSVVLAAATVAVSHQSICDVQRSLQESRQNPAIEVLERRLPGAVVAAAQDGDFVRDAELAELAHQILREIDRKRQVVARVDEQRLPIAQAIEIPARADRLPQRAQRVELDVAVEPLAHVLGRQSAPHDVGEVRRDVIERLGADQRLVRRRQQREARAEARAEDADALVALPRPATRSRAARRARPAGTPAPCARRSRSRCSRRDGARAACADRDTAGSGAARSCRSSPAAGRARRDRRCPRSTAAARRPPRGDRALLARASEIAAVDRVVLGVRRRERARKRQQPIARQRSDPVSV